jgi:hypothetical protein
MRTDPSQRMGDGVNPIQDPPTPSLRGGWLLTARTGWAAMLFALTLVTGAGFSMRALWALGQTTPALRLPARLVWLLATFLYLIVLFVVPDGRFVPRWTRALGVVALPVFVLLLGFVMPSLLVDTANAWFAWALLATASLFLLFTASVAVAILRHHLYDINRLVSRTLTYGLLTVVLGTLYAGAVVGLGQALNPEAATPRSPWPPPRCWWPRCFDRCASHPGHGRPALQPVALRRGQERGGVQRPAPGAGGSGQALGRPAGCGRADHGADDGVAVAAAPAQPSGRRPTVDVRPGAH